MDLLEVKNIRSNEVLNLDFSLSPMWLVSIDASSCDSLLNFITSHTLDPTSSIAGLVFDENDEILASLNSPSEDLNIYLPSDLSSKSVLQIDSIPWFTYIENSKILYSQSSPPEDLSSFQRRENYEEDLTELSSPHKNFQPINPLENKLQLNLTENSLANDLAHSVNLKASTELPNTSLIINKPVLSSLEKALKKIEKLRAKVKEQEKTIEEYKAETRELRALLAGNVKKEGRSEEKPIKLMSKVSSSFEPFQKATFQNKMQNKINPRIDENEFWKIGGEDEMQESVKFEDIAASKDLWLMGLFKAQKDSPKNLKNARALPPLQLDKQRQGRTLKKDNSNLKSDKRALSNNPASLSAKKIIKNT